MSFFMSVFTAENIKYLLGGALVSLQIAFGAMIIGLILGTIGAAMKLSKSKILNILASIYVEFIRGTPMLLQILFISLGIPMLYTQITGGRISLDPVLVGIIAIGLNSGAYSTELIRSGIQSIDKGQWEAAKTLGFSYNKSMRFIILPQVFRRLIPPFASEFIMLIKDSSLIYAIGGMELLGRSKVIGARTYNFIGPLVMAAIIYLVLTYVVSYFTKKLERRYTIID